MCALFIQVKRQLLEQAAKVEASDMRRKQRDAKKYGKALQVERRLDKEKRKHDDLAEITKWRKNKPAGDADRSLVLLPAHRL
jgi:rRNA-processing protein EBP2